jgi:SAM-dependent methyltransferase
VTDTAVARWEAALNAWALPERVLAAAAIDPWGHDIASFTVDDTVDRDTTSARWARDVLPPLGGTVLDVGCGGGRSTRPLIPPATEVIGVDQVGAMLDEYLAMGERAGVARRTVHGTWPEVAKITPAADLAVCHHVLFNVADIAPFVVALTARARLAVVVEVPVRHPMSAWNEAFRHFWGLERPAAPTHLDLLDAIRELGVAPEFTTGPRRRLSRHAASPATLVPTARRRLCLSTDRDGELEAWLDGHSPDFVDEVATIRWPGAAESD